MKILSYKQYNYLLDKIADLEVRELRLQSELKEAKDLKNVLTELTRISSFNTRAVDNIFEAGSPNLNLPDDVARYINDLCGGKVIKQEAKTRAIKIDKEGNVTTGYTKHKPNKGFTYKLIQE